MAKIFLQIRFLCLKFAAVNFVSIHLKPGREKSIERKHPWIFSGAIQSSIVGIKNGTWIKVYSSKNEYLCSGHFGNASIAVRILTYLDVEPSTEFFIQKLNTALQLRKRLNLVNSKENNIFRWVHGEGDLLPGLIIDVYENNAVVQPHTEGMYFCLNEIGLALQVCLPNLKTIFVKSSGTLQQEAYPDYWILGSSEEAICTENNIQYLVNWKQGQKTGFFIDQRDNRQLLGALCKDKTVLNTFCYSGGFSMQALQNQAKHVTSIDISKTATDLVYQNHNINKFNETLHQIVTADVMVYLKNAVAENKLFDIVILDPPAFAKSLSKKHNAIMAYKRLNMLGMKLVKPGGLLFTFSCSQVVDNNSFQGAVMAAAIELGVAAKILFSLTQGADHPINLFHPEGHYLKGLVMEL